MKYIYFDFGGSHSSVLAANIHVGNLNKGQLPSDAELMNLPLFDKNSPDDFGKMHLIGKDEAGNEVYVLGTRHSNFEPTIRGLATLAGVSQDFVFTHTMPYVNIILRIGGFLSRGLSWPVLGRPLVFRGARIAYPSLVKLVERTKVLSI
ncbi:MAG: DUF3189 family protein [Syntrophomonadaceae bacterium]|nr:DUF3189 family protein [Syntrophomonadaceae bacterium]